MAYALLLLFCIVFFELFVALSLGSDAMTIIARSREASRVLMSPDIGDDEKEILMRRGSVDIFKATLRFAAKFLLIGVALYLLFLLIVTLAPDMEKPMLEGFVSPVIIVLLSAGTMVYAWVRKSVRARATRRE